MHGIDMTDDSELISRVRDYIQKQGRYVTFDELSNAFNMSKITALQKDFYYYM